MTIVAQILIVLLLVIAAFVIVGVVLLHRTVTSSPKLLVAVAAVIAVVILYRVGKNDNWKVAPVRTAEAASQTYLASDTDAASNIEPIPEPPHASPNAAPIDSTAASDPAWINEPPQTIAGTFRTHIVAGPQVRLLDCQAELDQELLAAAREYVEREFGTGLVEPSLQYLRANVVADEFIKTTEHEFGGVSQNMYQVYWLLEFDESDRNYFAALSREKKIERRLAYAGVGLTSVLILLSTAFAYLRINEATAGRYRRRLQLATTAVILSLLGGAAVFVRLVPLV